MNLHEQIHGSLNVRRALSYHDDNLQFLSETWRLFIDIHADDGEKFQGLVAKGCLKEATLLVHSLKNVAALIGAEGLLQACIAAETKMKNRVVPDEDELAEVTTRLAVSLDDARALVARFDQCR